ncbi:hypothetical protein H2509_14530 [Stappia sp. F7233]|uniref:VCBS repeat-containing protein n=1 Tax=Stappia albiluteola TaxID=2758565 RepID=A0A839AHF3_9HYPH|nr:hypothetical protein [Stappia albiluteola]MBA5778342.1 hypothetical protein [Stappia albiluteola]
MRHRLTRIFGLGLLPLILAFAVLADVAPLGAQGAMPSIALQSGLPAGEVALKGLTLRLEMAKEPEYGEDAPHLTLLQDGRPVVSLFGTPDGFGVPQGSARFIEMDASNDTPEIFFTSYSGGAHCCTQAYAVTKLADGRWQAVDLGAFDGDGLHPEDIDGDGLAEVAAPDQRFLYAFDCYACSAAPQQIFALHQGTIRDVSREARFAKAQAAWLAQLREWREQAADDAFSPGFFAGYVAQSALVGKGAQAWSEMLAAYDPKLDAGFEMCPGQPFPGDCPTNRMVTVGYPEALMSFLLDAGYGF